MSLDMMPAESDSVFFERLEREMVGPLDLTERLDSDEEQIAQRFAKDLEVVDSIPPEAKERLRETTFTKFAGSEGDVNGWSNGGRV